MVLMPNTDKPFLEELLFIRPIVIYFGKALGWKPFACKLEKQVT